MFEIPTIVLPLWLLLLPSGLGFFIFTLYAFFNIYHLIRFATYSFVSYLVATTFIGGAIIIIAVSYQYLSVFDWTVAWTFTDFLQTTNL